PHHTVVLPARSDAGHASAVSRFGPRAAGTLAGPRHARALHSFPTRRSSDLTPENVRKSLTAEQYKLYKLIWSRFLACQMASAVYDSVSIEVESAGYTFRATHSSLKFSGYTAVYVEGKDEEDEVFQCPLPELKAGEPLELQ